MFNTPDWFKRIRHAAQPHLIAALSALLWLSPAQAQHFPKAPVKIILPFPPGGPTDTVGRMLGNKLQLALVARPDAPFNNLRAVLQKIAQDTAGVLALPNIKKRMDELGMEPVASTPEQFDTLIQSEMKRWARVIADAKISPK